MSNSQHITKVVNQCEIFTFLKKIDQNIIIINHSDIVLSHTIIIMTKKINEYVKIAIFYVWFIFGFKAH